MLLPTIVICLIIMTLALFGLAIRVFLVKNGEFKGGCASNNPMLNNEIGECSVCGRASGEACANPDKE